jgi:hypothetical protein
MQDGDDSQHTAEKSLASEVNERSEKHDKQVKLFLDETSQFAKELNLAKDECEQK